MVEVSGEMEGEGGGGICMWRKEWAVVAEKGNLLSRMQQLILSYYN